MSALQGTHNYDERDKYKSQDDDITHQNKRMGMGENTKMLLFITTET